MPFNIAVAGLNSTEQSALVAAIKAKAPNLTTAWTLLWEPSEFPENPDALLYCSKREDGKRWAQRYAKSADILLIAALLPLEVTPSEVPLFVRMPFKPQDIVDTLNVAARRIQAKAPEESTSSPQGSMEEKIDVNISVRGASRVDPLARALYAVFHGAEKTRFYKIRQTHGSGGREPAEIWCWPDLDLYWSPLPEEMILGGSDANFEIYNCPGKRAALAAKSDSVRRSGSLLWRSGTRAFKTAELLPWFPAEAKMTLARWPDLPKEARSVPMIRILSRLTRADATFTELLLELKTTRKDLSMVVNGLIMSGDLVRASEPRVAIAEHEARMDPEQALFLRALGLRCADALSEALYALDAAAASS